MLYRYPWIFECNEAEHRDGQKKILWIVYEHKSSLGLLSLTAWNINLKFTYTCVRLLKLSNTENIGKPSTWTFHWAWAILEFLICWNAFFLSRGYVHIINSFYISVSFWIILSTTKMQESRLLNNRALHKLKSWVKQCYFFIWLWLCFVISFCYIIQRAPSMLILI